MTNLTRWTSKDVDAILMQQTDIVSDSMIYSRDSMHMVQEHQKDNTLHIILSKSPQRNGD